MNLIDLREFEFERDKIILFNENEFIFGDTKCEEGICKRYFYKYNMKNKHIYKINEEGIETSEYASYNSCILNDYIYTDSYKVQNSHVETLIYRISLIDGKIDKLYSISRDAGVIILSEEYALLIGCDYGIDEEHSDVQKDIKGEYDYAILCDLKYKREYGVKDKRVILGIRDYFIPYTVDRVRCIVFEEAYMEDWELEDEFEEGSKKEDFYRNGYRESINIISLEKFVESIKNGYEMIPFSQIHKTELTAWTRYFGMDDGNIYYRTKDFINKIEYIYSIDKRTLEKKLLKSVNMHNSQTTDIWHDITNRKIYEKKIINDSIKQIKEIYDGDFIFEYSELKEEFNDLVGEYVLTSFWTEDDNGDNYKYFTKIRNIKSGMIDIFEGICIVIKDNIVLFKG